MGNFLEIGKWWREANKRMMNSLKLFPTLSIKQKPLFSLMWLFQKVQTLALLSNFQKVEVIIKAWKRNSEKCLRSSLHIEIRMILQRLVQVIRSSFERWTLYLPKYPKTTYISCFYLLRLGHLPYKCFIKKPADKSPTFRPCKL